MRRTDIKLTVMGDAAVGVLCIVPVVVAKCTHEQFFLRGTLPVLDHGRVWDAYYSKAKATFLYTTHTVTCSSRTPTKAYIHNVYIHIPHEASSPTRAAVRIFI